MSKTGIAWTNETWNPVTGCTKVSPGCARCYAEVLHDQRFEANVKAATNVVLDEPGIAIEYVRSHLPQMLPMPECYDTPFETVVCHEDRLMKPLSWRKPRMVFVNSMSDLFHKDVPDDFLDKVFAVMRMTPHVIFQILTKRPERMREYMSNEERDDAIFDAAFVLWKQGDRETMWLDGVRVPMDIAIENSEEWASWPPENIWLGTSVEDQEQADRRIPELLATPAAVRFISYEPALGLLVLPRYVSGPQWWVIAGGESGPKARPADIAWFRSLRDQCASAGVAFFMKQLGSKPYMFDREEAERFPLRLRDRHGGNPEEWPEDLRVRQFPEGER